MLIVLARHGDNGYITSGTVDTGLQTSKTTVKATSKLSKTALADYYNNNPLSDQRVNVFVLCNYTDELLASFQGTGDTGGFGLGDTSWIDKICEVSEADGKNTAIWSRGTMLMTNAAIATKMLPRTLKEWDVYSSASVPLDLSINSSTSSGDRLENNGAVRVERSWRVSISATAVRWATIPIMWWLRPCPVRRLPPISSISSSTAWRWST